MAKTADVLMAIWADPWFADLSLDAQHLYLWAITNEHSNLAGCYVVARRLIEFESKLTSTRFDKALAELDGKMIYDEETGTVWVRGRVKWARSKTTQIAKSIVRAVAECALPQVKADFMAKYGSEAWLSEAIANSALSAVSGEPHPSLGEAPSQSQGLSQSQSQKNPRDVEFEEWLADFHAVTGHDHVTGSKEARGFFNARREQGRSMADLKLATRGAHSDPKVRENGYDRPETILRESKIERYIALARKAGGSTSGVKQPRHREAT